MKISKSSAEHYNWGNQCDGWDLLKSDNLSVIHEKMPANTSERRHYHCKARQFFFILSGTATMELDGQFFIVLPQEGIEVPPLVPHQIFNKTDMDLEFLVISQPATRGDRVIVD